MRKRSPILCFAFTILDALIMSDWIRRHAELNTIVGFLLLMSQPFVASEQWSSSWHYFAFSVGGAITSAGAAGVARKVHAREPLSRWLWAFWAFLWLSVVGLVICHKLDLIAHIRSGEKANTPSSASLARACSSSGSSLHLPDRFCSY